MEVAISSRWLSSAMLPRRVRVIRVEQQAEHAALVAGRARRGETGRTAIGYLASVASLGFCRQLCALTGVMHRTWDWALHEFHPQVQITQLLEG